ncbi:hypothetical protein L3X38_031679 [Prunus dulcis]|uniref:Uncharacterized protein n=1 Tax=Prunus dulcis TaxID=3755 RepID=A0AAD4VEV0_PRUDU|nr:hypothetical protein L3X38_031679 [Prunus dulcis]
MIGSIDCMHWQWKNCPTAWQGDYGNRKGQKSIILEAVASFDTWVWHAFFGVAGSQNDLNVLGQSPVFNDVLRGEAPNITYEINNTIYQTGYYLADGIYPSYFVPDLGPELGPISPSGLPVLVAPMLARAGPLLLDVVF